MDVPTEDVVLVRAVAAGMFLACILHVPFSRVSADPPPGLLRQMTTAGVPWVAPGES